jgi:tetratricopeptide (TPR) repeat protein
LPEQYTERDGVREFRLGHVDHAATLYGKALDSGRASKRSWDEWVALVGLGMIEAHVGELGNAQKLLRLALKIARNSGDTFAERCVLSSLSDAFVRAKKEFRAAKCLARQIEISREANDKRFECVVLAKLGDVCLRLGELRGAFKNFLQSEKIASEIGNDLVISYILLRLAKTYRHLDAMEHAEYFYWKWLQSGVAFDTIPVVQTRLIDYYEKQLEFVDGLSDQYEALILKELGHFYVDSMDFESAQDYANQALMFSAE